MPAIKGAGAALAVAACATGPTMPTVAAAQQITPGVSTRDDVNKLMGQPIYSFAQSAKRPAESAYEFHDAFGQDATLLVTYDANGKVRTMYAERQEDH